MQLSPPIVETEGSEKVANIDIKSLSKKDNLLIAAVNDGHKAEVELLDKMNTAVEESEYSSAELEIDNDAGSYLRVATIDGVEVDENDEPSGTIIVTEVINGHLTNFMSTLNGILEEKVDEEISSEE